MLIEVDSVKQALQMMRPSFSGSEETVMFQVSRSMKSRFEALFRQVRGEQQAAWMTPETRIVAEKPLSEDDVIEQMLESEGRIAQETDEMKDEELAGPPEVKAKRNIAESNGVRSPNEGECRHGSVTSVRGFICNPLGVSGEIDSAFELESKPSNGDELWVNKKDRVGQVVVDTADRVGRNERAFNNWERGRDE